MDSTEIFARFDSQALDDEQKGQIEKLRTDAKGLALNINDAAPDGREKSLALTHLETAMFYAIAAVARSWVARS